MKSLQLIASLVIAATLSACGGKGTAKLQFSAGSRIAPSSKTHTIAVTPAEAQAMGLAAASSFQMKLIAAYLAEDIDPATQNNVGMTSMFWLNSECADDIMSCDTDPNVNGGKDEEGNTWRHTVTSFFDFSNVANVNSTLNSQGREIDTGTYKYVRLEFCKFQPTLANIKWSYSTGSISDDTFAQSSCNVTREISPPIEVADGDTVTITLAYDLNGTVISSGGATNDNCSGGFCFTLPTFNPSATK